jgi:hypothetical protein
MRRCGVGDDAAPGRRFAAHQKRCCASFGAHVKAAAAPHAQISRPSLDQAKAEEIVATAHTLCPDSNATRNNIPVRRTISAGTRAPLATV